MKPVTAHELQSLSEAAISRSRERHGAAPATVEAFIWELSTLGLAAIAGRNCLRRLGELSTMQLHEVIERLMRMRSRYPAITDELLLRLGDQL